MFYLSYAVAINLISVYQSSKRPSRNLTMTQMASSITKTSQTAWGPWATCLLRWSSLRSSSKSRWNVSIICQPVCDGVLSLIPGGFQHVCMIDGTFWNDLLWLCVSCLLCVHQESLWLCSHPTSPVGSDVCLWGAGSVQDALSRWLSGVSLQAQTGQASLHEEKLLLVCSIHLVIVFLCRLIPF